ncbi:hypothetical protein MFRU_037g00570 [Monilinia fructicola]|nr:hypothetical protein MFRU_037g00570 [Monilinia fructicola]
MDNEGLSSLVIPRSRDEGAADLKEGRVVECVRSICTFTTDKELQLLLRCLTSQKGHAKSVRRYNYCVRTGNCLTRRSNACFSRSTYQNGLRDCGGFQSQQY